MKKVLLLKPPYNFFPLGLAYVMTALLENDIPFEFHDLFFDSEGWKSSLKSRECSAVATGGLVGDYNAISGIAAEAKLLSPETPFILGGGITTDAGPDFLFEQTAVDYLVIGEAEETLPDFLNCLAYKHSPLKDIRGIAYRGNEGKAVVTATRARINLKHSDRFPSWSGIDVDHYLDTGVGGFPGFRAMPVLTGRGCTGKCTFCSPTNGPFRMRPVFRVIEEMRLWNDTYEFDGFAFINEIFYPNRKMIEAFLAAYRKSGIGKPWVCLLRVDMDPGVLNMMKDAGCIGVSFGVESGSDRVLTILKKRVTSDDIRKFTRHIKAAGIPAFGSFMLGNEGESEQELAQTIDFMIEEKVVGPYGMVIAYPGTQIYRNALERGAIDNAVDYIERLDFSQILGAGTFRNIDYLNISAMPDNAFFPVLMKHFRRYTSNMFRQMQARLVDIENLTGSCPVCGRKMTMPVKVNTLLGMEAACPDCFNMVYFNLHEHPLFLPYTEKLRERIAAVSRVVVYGTGINGRLLQLYDELGLDLEKIYCHVSSEDSWDGAFFFNHPVKKTGELKGDAFDLVIVADANNVNHTRHELAAVGIDPAKILGLLPLEWPRYLKNRHGKNDTPVASLFQHWLNMAIPPTSSEYFAVMVKGVVDELHFQTGRHKIRVMVMPCGEFARSFARQLFNTGVDVIAFMDNFKWRSQDTADGVPLVTPDRASNYAYDKILLVTPSYQAQQEMRYQLLELLGGDGEHDILLFGDLFLENEIKSASFFQ